MPEASLWFASPFKDWIGQRSLTLTWEGTMTLRNLWERLATEYPKLQANLPREGLQEDAMENLVAVIVDGDILTLDSEIRDGAKVDVLTPLSGGAGYPPQIDSDMTHAPCPASTPHIRRDRFRRVVSLPRASTAPPAMRVRPGADRSCSRP